LSSRDAMSLAVSALATDGPLELRHVMVLGCLRFAR
jgi:hypothetical protein